MMLPYDATASGQEKVTSLVHVTVNDVTVMLAGGRHIFFQSARVACAAHASVEHYRSFCSVDG